jgi:hypothetical protein
MNKIHLVFDSLKYKKSDEFCSNMLEMDLEEYRKIKNRIIEIKSLFKDDMDDMMKDILTKHFLDSNSNTGIVAKQVAGLQATIEEAITLKKEKVIEQKVDINKGTAEIKGIAFVEPQTPEEIIRMLKIDTSKWKLSTYWNKQQPGGYWLISALVTALKDGELVKSDLDLIIANIFSKSSIIPVTLYPQISNDKALFIYMSDKHIAAYVGAHALYENNYDADSYEQRMKLILHEMYYLKGIYGVFEDVYFIDLGDKMDGLNGFTTRGGHKLPQNMDTKQAFDTFLRVEKEFFDLAFQSGTGNNYHLYQNTNNNHGGDFDYMASRALEEYIFIKYPQVSTRVLTKFIEHMVYGKHVLLLTHGKDDEDMKNGLPKNLNDKTENYLNKYLLKNKIDIDDYSVSLIKGDLHVNTSETAYAFRYRNAMSLFGGSKWIGTNFGPTRPGTSYDIIEKNNSRILEGKIVYSTT